jgi:carnosine N-methyltransferase
MAESSLKEEGASKKNESLEDLKSHTFTDEEYQAERDHFLKVTNAFLYYRTDCYKRIEQADRNYAQLPVAHQSMLSSYPKHLEALKEAVDENYRFLCSIVESCSGVFCNHSELTKSASVDEFNNGGQYIFPATGFDMDKVRTTLKQFYRDWSKSGQIERDCCYKPVIEEIMRLFPLAGGSTQNVGILVPGAGLGRLAWEIARLGYKCQGNEFSMYMLLASNFILNKSLPVESVSIHPWVMRFSNNWSNEHQRTLVKIPDVDTSDLPSFGKFSMTAGDFLLVYSTEGEWDCVATCFFIDTAHNVIEYLEKIYHILKPGGYWINIGPLLYHFADMRREFSIEVAYQDIRRISEENIGFVFLKEDRFVPCAYINDPECMMQMTYKCVFSVAQKPVNSTR